ncbi:ribonuclease T2-like protein [Kockiozyma suomiensis]|uniref:ribonuclease T2-like protein n=1 Tax=Kockiozyma suomiensis TaxID=1337062 RepID=UPI00334430E4
MPAYTQTPYRDDEKAQYRPLVQEELAFSAPPPRRARRCRPLTTFFLAILLAGAVFVTVSGAFSSVKDEAPSFLRSTLGSLVGKAFSGSHSHPVVHRKMNTRVSTAHSCPADKDFSCHLPTLLPDDPVDTCCVNAPGGQLLLAQFWDFAPAVGPVDKWTLHGLWPDNCDGSFDQFCDPSRVVNSVETIFTAAGASELLTSMRDSWKAYQGADDRLWTHEWNKHGTCISTLAPQCYGEEDNTTATPMIEYFSRAVDLHSTLDTYSALADAGIIPGWDVKLNKTDILAAIGNSISDNHNVTLGCTKSGVLSEVWYHFNVRGRAQDGEYVFADPDGTKDSCPDTGIKYLPKIVRPPHPVRPHPTPNPDSKPFEGKGYVIVNDGTEGCVISGGQWYASGTCATFHGTPSVLGGVELSSSRGPCAVSEQGRFVCSYDIVNATSFAVGANNELVYDGESSWSAIQPAKGWLKEGLWAGHGSTGLDLPVEVELHWRGLL